jgi:hypothetical protein
MAWSIELHRQNSRYINYLEVGGKYFLFDNILKFLFFKILSWNYHVKTI